jgi:LuxR family maltose regulon positive regulatory protein
MMRGESKRADGTRVLIDAKLDVPKPPPGLVVRPDLIDRLDRGRHGRVTLVSAPAGYGKTTLVAQWLDRDAAPAAAWLSVDRLDSDLERFARNVVASVQRVDERCLTKTAELLSARNLPPPTYLARAIASSFTNIRGL